MDRKEELLKIISSTGDKNDIKAGQLIEEIVFLEEQLIELKKLPFIRVNPKDKSQQKSTPAAKQYKELLQQYNASLRLLLRLAGDMGDKEEESPLRKWLKEKNV